MFAILKYSLIDNTKIGVVTQMDGGVIRQLNGQLPTKYRPPNVSAPGGPYFIE